VLELLEEDAGAAASAVYRREARAARPARGTTVLLPITPITVQQLLRWSMLDFVTVINRTIFKCIHDHIGRRPRSDEEAARRSRKIKTAGITVLRCIISTIRYNVPTYNLYLYNNLTADYASRCPNVLN
jgi:hypothetical protein